MNQIMSSSNLGKAYIYTCLYTLKIRTIEYWKIKGKFIPILYPSKQRSWFTRLKLSIHGWLATECKVLLAQFWTLLRLVGTSSLNQWCSFSIPYAVSHCAPLQKCKIHVTALRTVTILSGLLFLCISTHTQYHNISSDAWALFCVAEIHSASVTIVWGTLQYIETQPPLAFWRYICKAPAAIAYEQISPHLCW